MERNGSSSLKRFYSIYPCVVPLIGALAMILVPSGLYLLAHRIKHGESGLKSYIDVSKRQEARILS